MPKDSIFLDESKSVIYSAIFTEVQSTIDQSLYFGYHHCTKPDSGGITIFGCAFKMMRNKLVPDRGFPRIKSGVFSINCFGFLIKFSQSFSVQLHLDYCKEVSIKFG